MVTEEGTSAATKTIDNAVAALIQLFKNTPIGEDFKFFESFSSTMNVRGSYDMVNEKTIAYALYRFAEEQGTKTLRVSELYSADYKDSPVKIFGISKQAFMRSLHTLNSTSNRVLIAELNLGLDHITLRDDLDPLSAVMSI